MSRSGTDDEPWFAPPPPCPDGGIAIIGAGIAGAWLAHALTRRGRQVTVFDPEPAGGASGNPAGLIMPRLDAGNSPVASFYRDAFLYAERSYLDLGQVFDPCGGTVAMEDAKAAKLLALGTWPQGSLSAWDGGVLVQGGGVLQPALAVRRLLRDLDVRPLTISGWRASASGVSACAYHILAGGESVGSFAGMVQATGASYRAQHREDVTPSLGQIDVFSGPAPAHVVTDGAYVAPLGTRLVAGATYARHDGGPIAPCQDNTDANRQSAEALIGEAPGAHLAARAALRATTVDRHPIAGPLYDAKAAIEAYQGLAKGERQDYPPAPYDGHVHALTGLGSRGLVTAPLLAEHIAAQICGEPSVLPTDQIGIIHPGRFLIRAIRRGQLSR